MTRREVIGSSCRTVVCCLMACVLLPALASAHALGENYIFVNFRDSSIDGRFEIHFDDLERKLGLRLRGTDAENLATLRANVSRVQAYIRSHFAIGPEQAAPYSLEFGDVNV